MSRSYKKHPICSDDYADKKFAKRRANKKVRSSTEVPRGKYYRKISESWNIADYRLYWTEEDAREWYRLHKDDYPFSKYKDEEDYIKRAWFSDFKRK